MLLSTMSENKQVLDKCQLLLVVVIVAVGVIGISSVPRTAWVLKH